MTTPQQPSLTKPNCYDCIHRGEIPGDAHSCCKHPAVAATRHNPLNEIIALLASIGYARTLYEGNSLGVTGNAHGIRKGWFCWPINFDPVWLETCNGFEQRKEVNPDESKPKE